ncbi:uridine kinase [Cellulomonas sp. KRMCY2]|uniref:uridine kinase n=1 Tax=Cellulomonas sp. KRMCY2 TaxID=1304865 RepID=UPI00045E6CB5|nr:uridine kinase [Cellulomonas sp. KRMCY2]
MQVRPLTPDGVVGHLVDVVGRRPEARLRVVVDGHPSTHPEELADALVDPLRAIGRSVVRVHATDFLRPASVRLEYGRHDPDGYYDQVDVGALAREVVDPWGPGGTGRYLPSLWDARLDRATRVPYAAAPAGGVLLIDGAMLLGRWLDLDLTVHLALRADTRARRTPPDEEWTLPAYARYTDEVAPEETADVVLRVDDARRPGLVLDRRS